MRTHPSVSFRLAATTLACAAALTAGVSHAENYFAVLPLLGADASQAKRPVKMVLASATPPTATVGVPYSFNLGALLSLDGPEGTSPANVRWSVVSGELPRGLELVGNEVVGTPTELAPDRQVVIQAEHVSGYSTDSVTMGYSFFVSAPIVDFGGYRAWADGTFAQSCEGYIRSGSDVRPYQGATGSGVYRISPPGAAPFDAYCDQVSDGGGWTRVALQYEGTPVLWTGQSNDRAYSLPQAQIPPHTYTGFGKDEVATYVDFVPFQYTAGDIPVTSATSPKTGKSYDIFRSFGSWFQNHDPEDTYHSQPYETYNRPGFPSIIYWNDTLTFDEHGKLAAFTWAFSPNVLPTSYQGYAMNGMSVGGVTDASGWSVWVK